MENTIFSHSQDVTIHSDIFAIMIQEPPQSAASNCLEVMSLFPSLFSWLSAKADLFRRQNHLYSCCFNIPTIPNHPALPNHGVDLLKYHGK